MAPKRNQKRVRLVVRIGALKRFDALKQKTADLPVSVEWDRRRGERRSAGGASPSRDQRKKDRRNSPPFTWDTADFVVVEEPTCASTDKDPK